MFRHLLIISLIAFSGNSFAGEKPSLDELKAKEIEHKCDIVKRLQSKPDISPAQKAELEKLQAEVKDTCN